MSSGMRDAYGGRMFGSQKGAPTPKQREGMRFDEYDDHFERFESEAPKQREEREGFLKAVRRLVVCARTTGGTAGPDQGLMDACEAVEDLLRTHSPEERERHGWQVEHGVTCVVCPGCAFTFDAGHEDSEGGYTCPNCEGVQGEREPQCTCEWAHPVDGAIDPYWPAELDPRCPVHEGVDAPDAVEARVSALMSADGERCVDVYVDDLHFAVCVEPDLSGGVVVWRGENAIVGRDFEAAAITSTPEEE